MSGAISSNPNIPKDQDEAVTTDCNLYWQLPSLAAAASNKTTLTVIGQTQNPLTPDQVIVVKVPLADFKEALVYKSNWVAPQDGSTVPGEQPYPDLIFNPIKLADAGLRDAQSLSAEGRFLLVEAEPTLAAPVFVDDGGDSSLWTLQAYFMNSEFEFGANSLISSIPVESVKNVEVGSLTVDVLSGTGHPTELFEKGGNVLSATYEWTTGADEHFVLDLFKQAEAAGKVKEATPNASGPPTSTATASNDHAGYSQLEFVANDSVTIYVTYNMVKSREVKLDDAVGGGVPKFVITIGGVATEFTGANKSENSGTTPVTIAYQFVAQ